MSGTVFTFGMVSRRFSGETVPDTFSGPVMGVLGGQAVGGMTDFLKAASESDHLRQAIDVLKTDDPMAIDQAQRLLLGPGPNSLYYDILGTNALAAAAAQTYLEALFASLNN